MNTLNDSPESTSRVTQSFSNRFPGIDWALISLRPVEALPYE